MKRPLYPVAVLCLLPSIAGAQETGEFLELPPLELGEVVAVDGFIGKSNTVDAHIEFTNGTLDGIWGVGGTTGLRIRTDDGLEFHTVWDAAGGAIVTFKSLSDPDSVFGGVWTANTSPVSPSDTRDLFMNDGVSMVEGAPLLLGFEEPALGLLVRVDLTDVDRVLFENPPADTSDPGGFQMLPPLELGAVVDVDGFIGKTNTIDVHIEFTNGTLDGIWGISGTALVTIRTDDGVEFRTVWDAGGGALVTYRNKSLENDSGPPPEEWFGAVWTSNTSPVSPDDLLDLFADDGVSVVEGGPLLLGFEEPALGLLVGVDLTNVDRVLFDNALIVIE